MQHNKKNEDQSLYTKNRGPSSVQEKVEAIGAPEKQWLCQLPLGSFQVVQVLQACTAELTLSIALKQAWGSREQQASARKRRQKKTPKRIGSPEKEPSDF